MDKDYEDAVYLLNSLLADEYVLYTKTRNAHWNITGSNFYELHKFFEIQYELLDVMIDDIAERVRALGHLDLGSMKDFLSITHLNEDKLDYSNTAFLIQALVADHETINRMIRDDIIPISLKGKDAVTVDFVTGLMEQHEKMVWMLRSFLAEPDFSPTTHIRNVTKQFAKKQI
jgi:starvation-inducible DNA-binding protein